MAEKDSVTSYALGKRREAGLETHLAIKPAQEREALSGVFGLLI